PIRDREAHEVNARGAFPKDCRNRWTPSRGSTKIFRQLAEVRQRSAVGVESGSLLAVGMEVQEHMSAAFHRDLGELGCRYEQEFVRELPLFRDPRQRRDVRGWRRH